MNKLAHDIDCKQKDTDYLTPECSPYCDYQRQGVADLEDILLA